MADEVTLQFLARGSPDLTGSWLPGGRHPREPCRRVSSSSWTKRWNRSSLGFALLFKGFMQSRFKLMARFDAADQGRTRVTITGTAHPRTRRALGELAAQHGGPVGLATGI